jgi:hypothetical protein
VHENNLSHEIFKQNVASYESFYDIFTAYKNLKIDDNTVVIVMCKRE